MSLASSEFCELDGVLEGDTCSDERRAGRDDLARAGTAERAVPPLAIRDEGPGGEIDVVGGDVLPSLRVFDVEGGLVEFIEGS